MKIRSLPRSLLATTAFTAAANSASAATLFDNYLERGYSEVAVYARTKALNDLAGAHFARKAADAARGELVMPDSPADTGRPLPYLVEFYDARTRLMEALAAGAADDNARMAAVAQVNYDCWLAQLSGEPGDLDSSSCRLLFYTALDVITDPGIDDFITAAGSAGGEARPGDHATGGNDSPDRLPPAWQAGPISALSSIQGEYEPAVWIYPTPVATPAAPSVMKGGGSENSQADSAQVDEAGDGSGTTGGTLGRAVGRTSDSLGGAVSGVGGALGDTVGGVAGAAGGAISGAGNTIGGPVGGIADAAGDTVSGVGGAVGGAVGGVAGAAGRAVSGLGGALGGALGGPGQERAN